jgi:hypothetical protein
VANTIAYVSELLDPKQLFLSLSRKPPMTQAFRYIFWGEGEVGLQVYSILIKDWNWTPPGDVRDRTSDLGKIKIPFRTAFGTQIDRCRPF